MRRPGLAHLLRHFIDAAAHDPASGRTAGPHQARTQVAASVDIAGPAPVTIDQRQLGPEPFAPDQPSPDPLGHDSAEQPRPRVFSVGGGRR